MHNLQKGKTQQQQLQEILNQTFPNSNYCDEDITQFIHDPSGNYENMFNVNNNNNNNNGTTISGLENGDHQIKWRKNSSRSSRKLSEQSEQQFGRSRALTDQLSNQPIQQNSSQEQTSQSHLQEPCINSEIPLCLQPLHAYYNTHKQSPPLSLIKQQYPNFIISQPIYNIGKTYTENVFQYNHDIIKCVNITCIDVAFCQILQTYRIVLGTDDARVLIFQRTYTKPVNIYEVFPTKSKGKKQQQVAKKSIKCVKWSQNLQYLAISSNSEQLKIYQLKQQIKIEQNTILRAQKQPLQLISLTRKQLKSSIKQIKFISQLPLSLIFNDDCDQIQTLDYKLHFINYKVYLNKLSVKFMDVFQIDVVQFGANKNKKVNLYKQHNVNQEIIKNHKNNTEANMGTLLAISSEDYVTICLLKPHFEIIMVYDKQKHGKNIKKQGYAHIEFRKQPQLGLLIVWDKYAHILNIQIQSVSPLQTKINNFGSLLLPQTTYCSGLVTNSLLYQISESGLKIYSTDTFTSQQKQCLHFTENIYSKQIKFITLPNSRKVLEILGDLGEVRALGIEALSLFRNLVTACQGELFFTTCCELLGVTVQQFQAFIRNTIENVNNWKIGLQLLCDSYKGIIKSYDSMSKQRITRLLQEYSQKYINFLLVIIGNTGPANTTEQSLWLQQTTFLFNILIQTQQYTFLFNKILPKLCSSSLQKYVYSLQPFILLQQIPMVTATGLQILFDYLREISSSSEQHNATQKQNTQKIEKSAKQMISRLIIGGLKLEYSEVDLPHQINGILLENGMYEEIVYVNVMFGDYLTPFVLLVSRFEKISSSVTVPNVTKNDMEVLLELKMKSSRSSSQQQKQQPNNEPEKQHLRLLILYLTNKLLTEINRSVEGHSFMSVEQKKQEQSQKQFLQTFLPLLQSSIINMLLDGSECQSALFSCILPQLFTGKCLQIINHIDNKKLNADVMSDIVNGINLGRVTKVKEYWVSVISLVTLGVVKVEVFMGVRHILKCMEQLAINNSTQQLYVLEQFLSKTVQEIPQKLSHQMEQLSRPLLEQLYQQLLNSQISHTQSHIGLIIIVSQILGQGYFARVVLAIMAFRQLDNQCHQNTRNKKNKNYEKKNAIEVGQGKNRNSEQYGYNVYQYLDTNIGKFNNAEKEQLKNIIYENIEYFVKLDSNKICDILIQHYLDSMDKFVKYSLIPKRKNSYPSPSAPIGKQSSLTIDPHIFLSLISTLLCRLQSPEIQSLSLHKFQPHSEWMLEQKLLYLKLLAMTGREKEILEEIKKQSYPLDSSLEICRQYGIIDAEAYLLVKSGGEGEIASAIKLYFELIMDKVKNLTPENVNVFKEYLSSIVRECVRVCDALHSAPDHFNEEWFIISQQLYNMKTSIYRILPAYTGDLLCDIIQKQLYPTLSQKIVRKEPPEGIIPYLHTNMQELDLIFIRSLLHELLKNNAYQKSILLLAQQTFIDNEIWQRKEITKKSFHGQIIKFQCNLCHEHAQQNELIIHYNSCKHQIHPSCGQDIKNCYICAFRVDKMLEKQFDIIRKVRVQLVCKEREEQQLQKEQVRKLSRIQKMRRFQQEVVAIDYFV